MRGAVLIPIFLASQVLAGEPIVLTPSEQQWIDNHASVRARIFDNPPLNFWEDKPRSLAVDYAEAILGKLGVRVEYEHGVSWSQTLEDIRQHKGVDLLLNAKRTPERESYLLFTDDYLVFPWLIFTRTDTKYIYSLADLNGRTVAVERGFVLQQRLAQEFPAVKQIVFDSTKDALLAVSKEQADAYIENLSVVQYHMAQEGVTDIVVAADTNQGIHTQAFAVRSDWPELVSILNKGLASMTDEELGAIRRKYAELEVRKTLDLPLLFGILGGALLSIGIFILWNRRLAAEIRLRNDAEAKLHTSERRLKEAEKIAHVGYWDLDLATNNLAWSDEAFRIFEVDKARFDANYEDFLAVIHPDDRHDVDTAYSNSLKTGQPYSIVHRLLMPDGRVKYVHERCETKFGKDGSPVRSIGTVQDITEQKLVELELEKHRYHRESLIASRIQERERHQLATELHDSPMQKLALAQLQISAAIKEADSKPARQLASGLGLMREVLEELRTLQFELSPPMLYREGLGDSLQWLAAYISEQSNISIAYKNNAASVAIPPDRSSLLFRCVQELVYNLVKHANAKSGEIVLAYENDHVIVTVRDDGHGFRKLEPRDHQQGGSGLSSIEERLALVDGAMTIDSSTAGTIIALRIPLYSEPGFAGSHGDGSVAPSQI
jgi:PAS domain S-box-containing protein